MRLGFTIRTCMLGLDLEPSEIWNSCFRFSITMDIGSSPTNSYSKEHQKLCRDWFVCADSDGDGRITGVDAIKFFAMSNLSRQDLKQNQKELHLELPCIFPKLLVSNGSHFERRLVPPSLLNKCDCEIDPVVLDFTNSHMTGFSSGENSSLTSLLHTHYNGSLHHSTHKVPNSGLASILSNDIRVVLRVDIELVQNLIGCCLQMYMDRGDVVETLLNRARIDQGVKTLGIQHGSS